MACPGLSSSLPSWKWTNPFNSVKRFVCPVITKINNAACNFLPNPAQAALISGVAIGVLNSNQNPLPLMAVAALGFYLGMKGREKEIAFLEQDLNLYRDTTSQYRQDIQTLFNTINTQIQHINDLEMKLAESKERELNLGVMCRVKSIFLKRVFAEQLLNTAREVVRRIPGVRAFQKRDFCVENS